ncbi:multicomponent Na+:H+ antiporter subunit D [Vibrio cholerae]|nr:multicomponent Na+:H+ antiporter subunit D [Vibrio cholerae]
MAAELYWLAAIALLVGLLTIFSMTKIWNEVFWKDAPVWLRSRFTNLQP